MKAKRRIQIGNNITDIMALPCVSACYKQRSKGSYIFEIYDGCRTDYAHQGDWLREYEDGSWQVIKKNLNT